ncbi:MAG: EAL domain-containing protein [Rubrivivax sp.]|nr:EAL domain-containing protein [Rubrivivax sp.]
MTTSPRILIVDDDTGGRRLTHATLKKAGFRVSEAGDGRAALEQLAAGMPDLILMDVNMPVMDGFEACAQLRRLPQGGAVPVVMMTGLDDTASIERAFEAGATDFITKPISWAVLPHRVRYMLRASAAINALQQNQRRLSNAQRIGEMGDWEWDLRDNLILTSEEASRLLGLPKAEADLTPADFFRQVHPDDAQRLHDALAHAVASAQGFSMEYRVVDTDGRLRYIHQQVELLERQVAGPALRLAGALHDVTRRKDSEDRIRQLAYYDTLTGLPNRLLFNDLLGRALAQVARHDGRLAVMFIDLDNFKRVNDTLGHNVGDQLLREASARLSRVLRSEDLLARRHPDVPESSIARLGGDEFIVLLTDIQRPEDAALVGQRLIEALSQPVVIQDTEIYVGGSIGVSLYPENGTDTEALMMNADTAMYRAKADGRGGVQFYDRSMNARALDNLHMEGQLRRAMERQEFVLHYQPRVDVMSGRIVGAEALIRWKHPERGLLLPAEFIPQVENAGLVIGVGEWAIMTVCAQIAQWLAEGLQPLPVAVNLASTHLREHSLPGLVEQALATHGVPAQLLEIEVTESILLSDPELSVMISDKLAHMGVHMAIDDFGTGYSSMSYLKRLPIGSLKIDRSFVRDLVDDPEDAAIVGAITALAHSLKLKVVAEGVETREQLEMLRALNCDEYQGFFTSRALPPARFAQLVREGADAGSAAAADDLDQQPLLSLVN